MPNVYQTVFGGNPVAPAIPTYLALSFSVNTVLGWPLESNITSPAVAEWIDCTATAPALTLQLSDARQVSTGYTAIFNNVGANTFTVLDAQGNTLMAPASGAAWILVLSDNSTLQGTWRALQLGAGTSVANAATLAGNGLKAITTTLNERIFINPQGSNYTIVLADRAACVEWTGGSGGTFTLTAAATLGSDWFCYIKNSGTGVLTLQPPAGTIDGTTNKTFNPNDSCIVVCDGSNFFTMGFGQSVASSFNFVTISLAGASGTVVLTGAQLNRISYKFTGLLAGNTTVQVPASIQQYWIDNETTGAFTLTISAGGAGTTFTVPQANRNILYCDGLNIVNAISSGAIQFADGTAAAPSITFASDTTLGFYKAGVDVLGISTAGVQRGVVNASGQWTINAPSSGTAFSLTGLAASIGVLCTVPNNATAAFAATDGTENLLLGLSAGNAFIGPSTTSNLQLQSSGTTRVTVSSNGNVTINAPSSGVAATITGFSGSDTLDLFNPAVGDILKVRNSGNSFQATLGTTAGAAYLDASNATNGLIISTQGSANPRVTVSNSGNVTISAPASGVALTVNGTAAQFTAILAGASGQAAHLGLQDGNTGNRVWELRNGQIGTGILDIFDDTANASRLQLNTAGNVTINAPSSGETLGLFGLANNYTLHISASSTTSQSYGLVVDGGTNGNDISFTARSKAGANYFSVRGDGLISTNSGTILSASVAQLPSMYGNAKAANTSRASTTTLTNDPDLAISIPVAGTYRYKIVFQATGSGGGLAFNVNYSGTFTAANSPALFLTAIGSGTPTFSSYTTVSAIVNSAYISTPAGTYGANTSYDSIEGMIVVTGAGTLALCWAQNASSGTGSVVLAGSYMEVVRIT